MPVAELVQDNHQRDSLGFHESSQAVKAGAALPSVGFVVAEGKRLVSDIENAV